ncbi:uncharacterized protein F4822DRAFT_131340 [Hypoxylon trugodes]|uniref:uncharacterized protein n=1 Tax=Hypoxylon trugodes TaxID=326681 RepID=UPI0021917172|nr:uncharacterized protein F4822DRAFT_131340 [Hypoxylon trugodes]KAI1392505.1 hypothetical protein F4822DRAFT_131340 [Hypoxylon trugodes]
MLLGLLFSLLAAAVVADDPPSTGSPNTLPVILPPFDYGGAIEKGLMEHLPQTPVQVEIIAGQIPQDCKDRAQQQNISISDIEVFAASYNDCDHPWTMCRVKSAKTNATTMASMFGKMPLGMREYIRHVMVVEPESIPGAAAVSSGDTILFSDTSYRLYIFAHEMSHSLDSHVPVPGVTLEGHGGLSISQRWADQFRMDTATVSDYARSAWQENLAENGPIALYNIVVPGGIFSLESNATQVFHQFATYTTYYRDIITPGGKKNCTGRLPDSPLVKSGLGSPGFIRPEGEDVFKANITRIPPGLFHNDTFIFPLDHTHSH